MAKVNITNYWDRRGLTQSWQLLKGAICPLSSVLCVQSPHPCTLSAQQVQNSWGWASFPVCNRPFDHSLPKTGCKPRRHGGRKGQAEGILFCFWIMPPPNEVARRKQRKGSIHPHSTWPSCHLLAWGMECKISAGRAPHLSCSLCPRVCCLLSHWRCNYLTRCRSLGKIAHFNQSTKWARLDDFTKCIWGEFCTAMSESQVIKWKGNKFPRGVNKHTKSVSFRCCAEWGKWISEWTATQGSFLQCQVGLCGVGRPGAELWGHGASCRLEGRINPWRAPCQMPRGLNNKTTNITAK